MASGVRVVGGSDAAPEDRGENETGADGADGADGEVVSSEPRAVTGAKGVAPAEGGEVAGGGEVAPDGSRRHPGRRRRRRLREGEPSSQRAAGRRGRAGVVALAVLAVLGVAGTIGFGLAWEGMRATQSGEAQARGTARSFLVDLTNFNAKTVDADFSAVSSMATGAFATQAQKFFNSSIRQDLQKALASSRGQIRALYVQSYGGGQATVYSVVDQLYVNDKLTSPQTDVLRIVVDLSQVSGHWKVADVTVLQGPSLGSTTASSGTGSTTTTSGTGSTTGSSGTGSTPSTGSTSASSSGSGG